MLVVATAGHVDHGKSSLVQALTGTDPDRLAEEKRRGLTLDLGHAHCRLPSGDALALVDVPGHERYLGTALTGMAGTRTALLVVSADEGWRPQTEEHWQALRALGSRVVVAVTRADVADPAAVADDAARRTGAPVVVTSARTGQGLEALLAALDALREPARPDGPVRMWVDRAFTASGRGTVVTGTMRAGRLGLGDRLLLGEQPVRVRGLQVLGRDVAETAGPARVAVLLQAAAPPERGTALLSPEEWERADVVDVRVASSAELPALVRVHLGAAQVSARTRPLGERGARLVLDRALPLAVGDRLLLRDPSRHRPLVAADVVEPAPPRLERRGAAAARAAELDEWAAVGAARGLVRRDGAVPLARLARLRLTWTGPVVAGHAVDEQWLVARAAALSAGLPPEGRRTAGLGSALGLPDDALVPPVAAAAGLVVRDGWVVPVQGPALGGAAERVAAAAQRAAREVAVDDHGLDRAEVALAVRTGDLVDLGSGLVSTPAAVAAAAEVVAALPQPFAVRDARDALGVHRRVAVALLEHLDATGRTRRRGDLRRAAQADGVRGEPAGTSIDQRR